MFLVDSLDGTGIRIGRYCRGSSLPVTQHVCHIGGNAYASAESPALTINISHHCLSPVDLFMHPTPQGVTLDFEQYNKLKDVNKVLPTLLPELKTFYPVSLHMKT